MRVCRRDRACWQIRRQKHLGIAPPALELGQLFTLGVANEPLLAVSVPLGPFALGVVLLRIWDCEVLHSKRLQVVVDVRGL